VRTVLDDFYEKLTDEQKAQFEAIGPGRTPLSSQAAVSQPATPTHHRRAITPGFPGIIRILWPSAVNKPSAPSRGAPSPHTRPVIPGGSPGGV